MDIIIRATVGLVGLLEDLYYFFFTPIYDVLLRAWVRIVPDGSFFDNKFFAGLFARFFGPGMLLENVTVFEFLLGGGLLLYLLIRLLQFISPLNS